MVSESQLPPLRSTEQIIRVKANNIAIHNYSLPRLNYSKLLDNQQGNKHLPTGRRRVDPSWHLSQPWRSPQFTQPALLLVSVFQSSVVNFKSFSCLIQRTWTRSVTTMSKAATARTESEIKKKLKTTLCLSVSLTSHFAGVFFFFLRRIVVHSTSKKFEPRNRGP